MGDREQNHILRECEYCNQVLEDDEELVPVFVGGGPEPQSQRLNGTMKRPNRPFRLLGKSLAELGAIYMALMDADNIDVETSARVERVVSVGGASTWIDDGTSPMDDGTGIETDRSTAGAKIRITPEFEDPEPDLQVCEHCKRAFKDD